MCKWLPKALIFSFKKTDWIGAAHPAPRQSHIPRGNHSIWTGRCSSSTKGCRRRRSMLELVPWLCYNIKLLYNLGFFSRAQYYIYVLKVYLLPETHWYIYIYINQRSAQNHSLPGMAPTAAAASTPIRTVKKPLQPVSEKKGFTPIRSPLLKKVKREVPREALYCENMTFVLLTSVKQNYCSINSSPLLHMPMPARWIQGPMDLRLARRRSQSCHQRLMEVAHR